MKSMICICLGVLLFGVCITSAAERTVKELVKHGLQAEKRGDASTAMRFFKAARERAEEGLSEYKDFLIAVAQSDSKEFIKLFNDVKHPAHKNADIFYLEAKAWLTLDPIQAQVEYERDYKSYRSSSDFKPTRLYEVEVSIFSKEPPKLEDHSVTCMFEADASLTDALFYRPDFADAIDLKLRIKPEFRSDPFGANVAWKRLVEGNRAKRGKKKRTK